MATNLTENPQYLNGLNTEQREAVETLNGPVLVLAGAGTGKTRALTARLAHLLHTHTASPGQILAVTFTNKAAHEMRERVSKQLGGTDVAGWWIGTFHSLAARMLRRHAELVGLRSNFTIIDDDDQLRLMKQVFELNNIDAKTINPRLVLALVDNWKNQGQTPAMLTTATIGDSSMPLSGTQLLNLYSSYQNRLATLNACDFGDLLLHLVTIFRDPANGVLAQYHARFKYIMVDEYQDTNTVQYQWLRLLAQANHNLCCVGDDDQSIYSWRGAVVANILNFEKDFPEAKIIRLEQNYRSTQMILNAANALIGHNSARLGKNLWTEEQGGDLVSINMTMDQSDEARQIADEIEVLQKNKIDLDDVAVLVRNISQMRAFEERFNAFGIPYKIVGALPLYKRQEIRDALAYLRLVHQQDDDLAFERIVNTPKRGIGPKTLQELHLSARRMNRSLFPTVESMVHTDELKPAVRTTLRLFVDDVYRWRGLTNTMPPHNLAEQVLEESGYTAMWRDDKSIEAAGRLDSLKELIVDIQKHDTLAAFLEHVALVMENQERRDQARVTLMTMHAAKGLEYAHVFLPGWEEGLFPSQRSMDDQGLAGLEEERRLAYVGLTRAKRKAMIFYALRRQTYGEFADTVPSRFIDELPKDAISDQRQQMKQRWGAAAVASTQSWGGSNFGGNRIGWGGTRRTREDITIDSFAVDLTPNSAFRIGQRVFHEKFGYGKVLDIDDDKLDVRFDKAGEKKVLDRFVQAAENN